MKNSLFIRFLRKDLFLGLNSNKTRYFLSLLLFVYLSYMFTKELSIAENKASSITNFWFYFFQGIGVYNPSSGVPFVIPFTWIIIQVIIALLVLNYPSRDLFTTGVQSLIRIKKRSYWWTSKCIWNFVTIIFVYLVAFICAFIFSAFLGEISLNFSDDFFCLQKNYNGSIIVIIYLMPVLTSIAISMVQMLISILLKPIYSFVIVICYLIVSSYYCSPILIGNYSMLLRSSVFDIGKINFITAVIVDVLVIIFSAIIGLFYFNRVDIIKKG